MTEIVQRITDDPTFRGPTGKFDRGRFEQLLRSVGYTEQRFVAEQRRLMLRRQIVDSLTGDLPVPKAWLEAINQFQNQQRSIAYVALGPAQAGDIPQPTAEQLTNISRRARSCSGRRNIANRDRRGDAGGARQVDGNLRRRHQGGVRRAP